MHIKLLVLAEPFVKSFCDTARFYIRITGCYQENSITFVLKNLEITFV